MELKQDSFSVEDITIFVLIVPSGIETRNLPSPGGMNAGVLIVPSGIETGVRGEDMTGL